MSNWDEVNGKLLSGGAQYFKFDKVGVNITGLLVDGEWRDETDMEGNIKRFPDGTARRQLVLTIQTDLREHEEDNGLRTVYTTHEMRKAIAEVAKPEGGLADGGKLQVTFTGVGEPAKKGQSGAKLFKARYKAPERRIDLEEDDSPF